MQTYIMPKGYKLYRYDLNEPPCNWSINHKNPEYQYGSGKIKNQFNGFFFFNSFYQTIGTCKNAIEKNGDRFQCAWLTKCETICETALLDIRKAPSISALFLGLYKNGFDIFNDNFSIYKKEDKIPFSIFRKDLEEFSKIVEDEKWYLSKDKNEVVNEFIRKIETLFIDNDWLGFAEQSLTDFENGISFSKLLQEKNLDGYIFNEANRIEGSDTVCFIDNKALSDPKCEKVEINKIFQLFNGVCKEE